MKKSDLYELLEDYQARKPLSQRIGLTRSRQVALLDAYLKNDEIKTLSMNDDVSYQTFIDSLSVKDRALFDHDYLYPSMTLFGKKVDASLFTRWKHADLTEENSQVVPYIPPEILLNIASFLNREDVGRFQASAKCFNWGRRYTNNSKELLRELPSAPRDYQRPISCSSVYKPNKLPTAVAMCQNGLIAVGYFDRGEIELVDHKTKKLVARLKGHSATVNALTVTQAGLLVSGSKDGDIRIWDTNSLTCIKAFSASTALNDSRFEVCSLASMNDGTILIGATIPLKGDMLWAVSAIYRYDLETDNFIPHIKRCIAAENLMVLNEQTLLSLDSWEGKMFKFSLETSNLLKTYDVGRDNVMTQLPNGSLAVGQLKKIMIYSKPDEIDEQKPQSVLTVPNVEPDRGDAVQAIACTNNGSIICASYSSIDLFCFKELQPTLASSKIEEIDDDYEADAPAASSRVTPY